MPAVTPNQLPSRRFSRRPRRRLLIAAGAILLIGGAGSITLGPAAVREVRARLGRATIADRLAEIGPRVEPLWRSRLEKTGLSRLPTQLTIVVIKARRELIVFAPTSIPPGDTYAELARFSITAASGNPGPKLREGDNQVPEGIYRVESLNPNSRYRLALRVNYPSADDRRDATADGRDPDHLGGDIMIHGGAASIGCIAIGDPAIEELFWLVATVGYERVELVFTPDLTPTALITSETTPWLVERYRKLADRLRSLGLEASPSGG